MDELIKNIKVEKELVSEEKAKKDKNAIFLDSETKPSTVNDLEKLTSFLATFLEYICTDDMEKMAVDDHPAYIKHLEEKFEEFSVNYFTIFRMLTDKNELQNRAQNITKLLSMIEIIREGMDGKRDMKKEFEIFKEKHAEQYLYPKFGGKEQFEETIKRRGKRRQLRKRK